MLRSHERCPPEARRARVGRTLRPATRKNPRREVSQIKNTSPAGLAQKTNTSPAGLAQKTNTSPAGVFLSLEQHPWWDIERLRDRGSYAEAVCGPASAIRARR